LRPSQFTIIGASAGSGKTFAITKAYLKLVLSSKNNDAFKHILAITFTNKAVGEMKERIIQSLKNFSATSILTSGDPLFGALIEETGMTALQIHNRSKELIWHLLHNYGGFEVSTIDSFVHRIIRTFAKDLQLSGNFEVELDQDDLLSKAVDQLISKADATNDITPLLVEFALEKSNEDKSFDISYDLRNISKLLISEKDLPHIMQLQDKSSDDFRKWKEQLKASIQKKKENIQKAATEILSLMADNEVSTSDFIRGLGGFFTKLSQNDFSVNFTGAWQVQLEAGADLYLKKASEKSKASILSIQTAIAEGFLKIKDQLIALWLDQALFKNLIPLSLLKALQVSLNEIKAEENKILISEFNSIIKNEIKEQPSPFIFEKLGEKIKHYFIDEFQDTSLMQWANLIPLVDHSLSGEGNSATIVGDAKQAIYRWRGGDVDQFASLMSSRWNPFQAPINHKSLDYNYRSSRTIVNFNNEFFEHLKKLVFSDPEHARIFELSKQHIHNETEGYIDFQFFDSSDEAERDALYLESLQLSIKDCLERGYSYSDMCILVRKHKHGIAVAGYLAGLGLPINSSEALLLAKSTKVQLLLKTLELHQNPQNEALKVSFLYDLAALLEIKETHKFISQHLSEPLVDILSFNFKHIPTASFQSIDALPLFNLVEFHLEVFNFNRCPDSFVLSFLDEVLAHALKRDGDIGSFLQYFEQKKDKLSISTPGDRNAISVMTIHKAKGLEFPVVMFPFAEIDIYEDRNSHLWVPVDPSKQSGFSEAMLNVNKQLELLSPEAKILYETHKAELELDHINLLYVALTRPIKELYIIGKNDINSKGVNLKSFTGLFISFLQQKQLWNDQQNHYSIGIKQKASSSTIRAAQPLLEMLTTPRAVQQFQIITKSGSLWDSKQEASIERGNIIHKLLSYVKTTEDLPFALNQMLLDAQILPTDRKELERLCLDIINHPKLRAYYSQDYSIYNERDVLSQEGEVIRPDRLCIRGKEEAVIIDYKTGVQNPTHRAQMSTYMDAVSQMIFKQVKGYLVYTNKALEIVKI
jgi:ATP-dependent exoDNAse (exonuclease V) beta subunit